MHRRRQPVFASSLALLALAGVAAGQDERPARPDGEPRPAEGAAATEPFETIQRTLPDRVVMTADLYRAKVEDPKAPPLPVLACFHMTSSSRGEYRMLAPELAARGFHVLAVDLRCGGEGEKSDRRTKKRSGTMNETWKSAREVLGKESGYVDAYPDVGAAVDWARELFPRSRLGLVGSSYSAALVLVWGAHHQDRIDAVISLSPADCLKPRWSVPEEVRKLTLPTYITCGNTVADSEPAKAIAGAIENRTRLITFWPEDEHFVGDHGSRTFFVKEEESRRKQWEVMERALEPLRKPPGKPRKPAGR